MTRDGPGAVKGQWECVGASGRRGEGRAKSGPANRRGARRSKRFPRARFGFCPDLSFLGQIWCRLVSLPSRLLYPQLVSTDPHAAFSCYLRLYGATGTPTAVLPALAATVELLGDPVYPTCFKIARGGCFCCAPGIYIRSLVSLTIGGYSSHTSLHRVSVPPGSSRMGCHVEKFCKGERGPFSAGRAGIVRLWGTEPGRKAMSHVLPSRPRCACLRRFWPQHISNSGPSWRMDD